MKTIITFILSALFVCSIQAKNTSLSFNLEKGKVYKMVTSSKSNISQEVNGQKMDMAITINGTLSFLVKSVNANGYAMEAEYKSMSMSMQMPQGSMEFSSEKNDSTDIFSTILGAMTNKPFNVTMDKTGKITEIKDIETIWKNAIDLFKQLPEQKREQIKAQILKSYGNKAIKGNIELSTAIYPNKPVQKGDKWTINTSIESGVTANVTTNYEFKDLTPDYALIIGTSTMKTSDKDKDKYIETNGMSMKYDITGTMQSNIKVDKKSGWIIEAKIKQEIKNNLTIKGNAQIPNGMTIPMTIESETAITGK